MSSDWLEDVSVPFMLKIIQNFTCESILLIERQSWKSGEILRVLVGTSHKGLDFTAFKPKRRKAFQSLDRDLAAAHTPAVP